MPTIGIRKAAALLLAVALLAAAAPAVAAPERPAEEARLAPLAPKVLEALGSWLSALWPGAGSDLLPEPVREALGSVADPDGTPEAPSDDPKAEPQLGSGLDPNG